MTLTFQNIPPLDFSLRAVREDFSATLNGLYEQIAKKTPDVYPLVAGKEIQTREVHTMYMPGNFLRSISTVHYANTKIVDQVLELFEKSTWRKSSKEKRIELILKLADCLEKKRLFLAAIIVLEVGKPWKEADADVIEAIDFCRYYASLLDTIDLNVKTDEIPGEENYSIYRPKGTVAVIAPWNFPLAILCGMTVGALLAGNCVAIKPAEQSSYIGFEFAKLLQVIGLPEDAFAFLPGCGESIGSYLAQHPDVHCVAFTGSRAVGMSILKESILEAPQLCYFKRIIAETGGKNCIIIDEDADLDEAIKAVVYSSFGFAGQKCSACSRVIVTSKVVYDKFTERLFQTVSDIIIGDPMQPQTFIGPVIDKESYDRLMNLIESVEKEDPPLYSASFKGSVPQGGWFIPPVIYKDVAIASTLWREELFGPLLSCRYTDTFEEAIRLANQSPYGLTGGIMSRHPKHIAYAKEHFRVGNLYINRGITGAIVNRQPFGGVKLSGYGFKAGGKDYLLQFMDVLTQTENTMRKGYSPEID
jgi:RHH-type transcriptional regulator, proline utilization regulon repressor / proline dehydrogenase / delta 1-pyrroline-5-carboxylate dehydrogenase